MGVRICPRAILVESVMQEVFKVFHSWLTSDRVQFVAVNGNVS